MATLSITDIGRVIIEPSPTFARLKEKPSPWLPLLTLIVLTAALTYWWISTADFDWLREHMITAKGTVKPEERAAIEKFITPSSMLWTSLGGAVIGTLIMTALTALYYVIASKFIDARIGFGKWFAFVAWVSVPRLLVVPLSAIQIMTAHGRLAPEDLNMVSLNYLLFHLPQSNPWANLLGTLDLASFWACALAAVGLKAWTGRSTATCLTIAVLPFALVYGLWAAKIVILG